MDRKYLEREKDMWDNGYSEDLDLKMLPFYKSKFIWSYILLQVAKLNDVKTTLEAGAGSGKFSFVLADEGYDSTAMDFNENIIKNLKKNNKKAEKKIKVIEGNVLDMPFDDNSFDMVFSEGVAEHFLGIDREKAIKEHIRVSNNKIVIFVPNASDISYIAKYPDGIEGEYPFTKEELKDMCELCGMKNIELYRMDKQIFVIGDKNE